MKTYKVIIEKPDGKKAVIHKDLTEKQAIEYTDYIDNTYYEEDTIE